VASAESCFVSMCGACGAVDFGLNSTCSQVCPWSRAFNFALNLDSHVLVVKRRLTRQAHCSLIIQRYTIIVLSSEATTQALYQSFSPIETMAISSLNELHTKLSSREPSTSCIVKRPITDSTVTVGTVHDTNST
jgi:hypothetical protein